MRDSGSAWAKVRTKKKKPTAAASEGQHSLNIGAIRKWASVIGGLATFIQLAIDYSAENILAAFLCFAGTLITVQVFLNAQTAKRFPISTWMVLLFCTANLTGPLVLKTFEFEPLTYKLTYPNLTFGYSLASLVAVMFGHWLYTRAKTAQRIRDTISNGWFRPLGLFRMPSESQFWIMGGFGTLAYLVSVASRGNVGGEEGTSTIAKLAIAGFPFAYAPFLIPFRFLITEKDLEPVKTAKWLPIYFCLNIGVALANNGRAGILFPVVTIAMCWLIGYFCGCLPRSYRQSNRVLAIVLISVLAMPFMGNLALAMVAARREKEHFSPADFVKSTISNVTDSRLLSQIVLDEQSDVTWDETYVHNPVLARFVNTRFHDNLFIETNNLTQADRELFIAFLIQRQERLLPTPLLNSLGANVDKSDELSGSSADYLHYLRTGSGLSGHRTGSLIGEGVYVFGPFFLPILVIASVFLFVATDAFTTRKAVRSSKLLPSGKPAIGYVLLISPAVLMMIWSCVYLNVLFSVVDWPGLVLRNNTIHVLYYVIIMRLSRPFGFTKAR